MLLADVFSIRLVQKLLTIYILGNKQQNIHAHHSSKSIQLNGLKSEQRTGKYGRSVIEAIKRIYIYNIYTYIYRRVYLPISRSCKYVRANSEATLSTRKHQPRRRDERSYAQPALVLSWEMPSIIFAA